ncbi:PilZ domain-containing protein [Thermodesulfobacteriota bacterium]
MEFQERRKNVRVLFRTTTKLIFKDKEYDQCETKDLSVDGVCVVGIDNRQSGEECDITMHLSGKTSELLLKLKAEVVRTTKDGLALQFFDVDQDCFNHLKNIVYYNYKHPDEVKALQTSRGPEYYKKPRPSAQSLKIVGGEDLYVNDFDNEIDDDVETDIATIKITGANVDND